ncbi:hypothetical protein [Capnocytophaga leadbetteri]|uniref:hypothetical protein n=1 Tax=Capnocytophaga leadbetteri TaxID=327575 RepID=UPI0026EB7E3C|nr:hypothetical protein [Capnocytophaga leadbetteri]
MNWQNLIWSASRTGDCGASRTGRNVGRVGQVRQVGQVGQVGVRAARAEMWDEWENYSVIIRLSFAYPSLIVRSLFTLLILFSLYCSLRFFNFYIF